jgi:esterase
MLPVNGARLHVQTAGDPSAPPVLVLHGIMGHVREWDVVVAALAPPHRVVAVDQRGHGRSQWTDGYDAQVLADDVIAITGHLGLERPAVVAHSMGAIAAMLAAARCPDRFEWLVVLDVGPDTVSGEMGLATAAFLAGLAGASYASVDEAVAEWSGNPLADEQHLRHYVTHALTTGPDGRLRWRFDAEGLQSLLGTVSEPDLWAAVDAITCPVLIVRGQYSPALSPGTAEAMRRRLRDARLAVLPDAAHDLGVEQPRAIAALVTEFLATQTRA